MTTVSFKDDIAPLFRPFRGSMMWRLDLADYESVKLNASIIHDVIQPGNGMPPPPFPPLTAEQVACFQRWIDQGYPA